MGVVPYFSGNALGFRPKLGDANEVNTMRKLKENLHIVLLKSELLTKQACRDKPCSLIFFNSTIYI